MNERDKPTEINRGATIGGSAGDAAAPVRDPGSPSSSDPSATPTSGGTIGRTSAWGTFVALQPGRVLANRYEILEMLGEGGMGAVYKARDREVDRLVALKVIRPDLAGNAAILQRFKQEMILARKITHKNVIRIFDLGEAEGVRFITMEFVEGENLHAILRRQGKVSPDEVIQIMLQVCRALYAAHSEGVVHRDLKPENIMRDRQDRILVMDFGLARSLELSGMTQSGALLGTMEYMSPEQALGQEVDQRSDVFTVGLIFFELLTGKIPFKADSAVASLLLRTRERAPSVAELEPGTPPMLVQVVSRCLARDPKDRYQSVQEILTDLDPRGTSRAGSSAIPLVAAARPRSWKWPAVAAGVVLLAVTATWYWMHLRSRPQAQHAPVSVLIADFNNQTQDAVFDGTLEPALGLALEAAPFINTYNRGSAHRIAEQLKPGTSGLDDAAARLVALREGVSVVVTGSIVRQGEGYKITTDAVDGATGKPIAKDDVEVGSKDEVLRSVGKLAASLRSDLGDTRPASAQLLKEETFTSSSLEAAHHYAQAQELLWQGKAEDAIREYLEAVKLDPNMGRAYAGLGAAYQNLGNQQQSEQYYQLALSHLNSMTEREKYRTRAGYYLITRNPDKAIEDANALVKLYPADSAGIAELALAYFYKRNMGQALEAGHRFLQLFPKNVPQRNNVGLYAMYAGDFDSAIQEQRQVLDMNPKFALAYVGTALSQLGQGKVTEAGATWKQLEGLGPHEASMAAAGLADLDMYQGKMTEANKILEEGVKADLVNKDSGDAATKLILLAECELALDHKPQALAAAERALGLGQGTSILVAAARIQVTAGQEKKALDLASKLGESLAPDPQMYAKLIQGEVELGHHNARAAVSLFQEAQKLGDAWLVHFDLGRAYLEAGAFPEADDEFETCLKRRGEATAVFLDEQPSYHLLPPVYYYLGRAQEGLKSAGAADSYKTYLSMQGNGDPLELAADARKRLAQH